MVTIEHEEGKPKRPRDSGNLHIDVEVYGGAYLPAVIREMAALATRLEVDVWANLNGTRTLCRPGDDPNATMIAWEKEQTMEAGYRYASA